MSHPNKVSTCRQIFIESNIDRFDFSKGFKRSAVCNLRN